MSDDLMIPTVPEPKPEDPEDVSWALSTAEAMWARGDHLEGIKWVRRAAEAASEAEDDSRALELAKVAADLAGMISRRMSHASIDIEEVVPISEPTVAAAAAPPPPPPVPAKKAPPAKPAAPAVTKPIGKGASRPPAPLPSRTSQPPAAKPASMRPGAGGAKKSRRSRENLDAEAKAAFGGGGAGGGNAIDTAALDAAAAAFLPSDTSETAAIDVPNIQRALQQRRAQEDPTVASNVNDIKAAVAAKTLQLAPESDPLSRERDEMGKSTDEWDAAATQNLSGDELPFPDLHSAGAGGDHDRMTSVNAPPTPDFKTTMQSFPRPAPKASAAASAAKASTPASSGTSPPATVVGQGITGGGFAFGGAAPMPTTTSRALRNESGEQHDPGIVTTQAVRVVVWRDANGVHVAPAGTVVSAITVEAVLVALEPHADLTAWLSPSK